MSAQPQQPGELGWKCGTAQQSGSFLTLQAVLAHFLPSPFAKREPGSTEEEQVAAGGCPAPGLRVFATSLVRQSKRLRQLPAALRQSCSGRRKPPCDVWRHCSHPDHAASEGFQKMLSQSPMTQTSDLAELGIFF